MCACVTYGKRMVLVSRYVVYYESIKRELKIRSIYECRCDERLQTKSNEFTRLAGLGRRCVKTRTQMCEADLKEVGCSVRRSDLCVKEEPCYTVSHLLRLVTQVDRYA